MQLFISLLARVTPRLPAIAGPRSNFESAGRQPHDNFLTLFLPPADNLRGILWFDAGVKPEST